MLHKSSTNILTNISKYLRWQSEAGRVITLSLSAGFVFKTLM